MEVQSNGITQAAAEYIPSQEKFLTPSHVISQGFGNFLSDKEVTRRHSISLIDRTPPPNSLAADILGRSTSVAAAKSLLSQLSDMQESLSEFNSCLSSSSSDESGEDLKNNTRVSP